MGWKLLKIVDSPSISWNLYLDGWLPNNAQIFYSKELLGSKINLDGQFVYPETIKKSCADNSDSQLLGYYLKAEGKSQLKIDLDCTISVKNSNDIYVDNLSHYPPNSSDKRNSSESRDERDLLYLVENLDVVKKHPLESAKLIELTNPPPSRINSFPQGIYQPNLEVSGIYPDGWLSQNSLFKLTQPKSAKFFKIEGFIPNSTNPAFSTQLTVLVDSKVIKTKLLSSGKFQIAVSLLNTGKIRKIELNFSKAQFINTNDPRKLAAQLRFIGFQ
jgi:hypothetical protein